MGDLYRNTRFAKLWQLMSVNNFVVAGCSSNEVFCTICKKIMIEPYSSECGCKFCKKCINEYLGSDTKKCPGSNNECFSEYLKIGDNVSKDNTTSNIIGSTTVKCPNEGCNFEKELNSIEEHIRVCKMKLMPCPYQAIGCGDNETTGENINNHLVKETLNHSQLLIDAINNLKNDFAGVTDIKNRKEEIFKVFEKYEETVTELANQKIELNTIKGNTRNYDNVKLELSQLREEKEDYKREIDYLKEEMKALKIKGNEGKIINDETETRFKEGIDLLKKDLEIVKKNVEVTKEYGELRKQLDKQNQEIEILKSKISKYSEEIEKLKKSSNGMVSSMSRDFVWTIEDLLKKKGEHFSNTFTTNYYKLCLRAWFGTDNIWIFLCVRMGERDDKAEWPMKHSITLSIINQETLTPYWSERYSMDTCDGDVTVFNRPSNDTDCRIGNMKVSLSDIKSERGLLLRNSLMVCCSLMPPSR